MQNTDLENLRRTTLSVLDESRPAYSLRTEVLKLKSVFEGAAGPIADETEDISAGETRVAVGLAISPTMASMCIDDFARTVQFLRGLNAAVLDLRKRISDRPLRVLYAGCGPWATLAVPLMSIFPPSVAGFTLLDIHETSIDSLRSLVATLKLSESVTKLVVCDAMGYDIGADPSPDIILIEMMRAALEIEPQVPVAIRLLQQAPNAVMIPEEICVDLALVDPRREFSICESASIEDGSIERDRIPVGEIFNFSKDMIRSVDGNPPDSLPAAAVRLPEFDVNKYRPMLLTRVRTYSNYFLRDYDAGITCPRPLRRNQEVMPGRTINFSYALNDRPGFRID